MKKLMALVLSVAMVLCSVPAAIFAADTDTSTGTGTGTTAGTTTDTQKKDLSKAVVELAETSYTYTGDEIKPEIKSVKIGDEVVPATGYDVTYANNINVPGAATDPQPQVVLTGKGDYAGTAAASFTIGVKAFTSEDKPVIDIPTQNVGVTTLANVTVTWNGKALTEGKDFDVTAGDNSSAGTHAATVAFKGNFSGSFSVNYNVVNKDLSQAALYLDELNASYTFDGTAKEPGIKLELANKTLVEGTDYVVKYENNVNAGTATIRAIGAGSYAGEKTITFTIAKADLKNAEVIFDPDAYTATGSAITPTFTVKVGDYIVPSADYAVSLSNNVAIGEATLTLTAAATGSGNLTGTKTAKFNIVGKAAADLDVTVDTPVVNYDGLAKTPSVTVKDGTVTLVKDTDYTVSYEDNTYAGTAKVIVTGKGKYAGTKTATFTIKGKDSTITTDQTAYTKYVPTSKPFNLNAKSDSDATGFTYTSSNEDVIKVSASGEVTIVDAGKATITIATVGTKAYDPATKVVTVTVKPLKPTFTLSSPAKKQVKVLINKEPGATKYIVEYGRNGKYYTKTIKHLDNEFTRTYTTLANRTSGKTYYIRVKAVKVMDDGTVVEGNWSARKKIKSK